MVRQETSTGSPRSAAPLVWLVPVVITAVPAAIAAVQVPESTRAAVIWIGVTAVVAIAVACYEAARRGYEARQLEAALKVHEAELSRQRAETARLAGDLLPGVVRRLRGGEFPEDVIASLDAPTEHQAVLSSVLEAVVAEEDLRESAQRAFVNIARRVQAIVHQQAQELREMEDRHGKNPEVFGDLLRIDHGTALIGRLADSIAVLGGARPGRQWTKAVPLYSVLRGAMSRIIDYQRVELHSVSEVAVVGPAVEPLIHALAELLDNATRYSPPQTRVHLTAVDVNSGIAVEIEDGGVSMSEEARRRAERMLQQAQEGIDVNDLGETPRLGLAVVGRLAQVYGFQVSLRSSAYGGVRAVIVVPKELITTVASATGVAHGIGASSGPRTGGASTEERQSRQITGPTMADFMTTDDELPIVTERTATGLPQRRRKAPAAATPPTTIEPEPKTKAAPSVQPGMWLTAFQNGVSGEATQTNKGSTQP
ncbi:sensor histidine kinase [Streptomyces sp. NPDC055078]